MFLGTYHINFSGKNRLSLPKKMRVQLSPKNTLILTQGLDEEIWGFSQKEWYKQAKIQLAIPITEKRGRILRRAFFALTEVVNLDNQGRFIIPNNLLTFFDVNHGTSLVGAGDHLEIWDRKKWENLSKRISL